MKNGEFTFCMNFSTKFIHAASSCYSCEYNIILHIISWLRHCFYMKDCIFVIRDELDWWILIQYHVIRRMAWPADLSLFLLNFWKWKGSNNFNIFRLLSGLNMAILTNTMFYSYLRRFKSSSYPLYYIVPYNANMLYVRTH